LNRAAAESFSQVVSRLLENKDHVAVALSGGSTPRPLYEILASEYTDRIAWNRVHLYWGDERYVPHRDPVSNFHLFHGAFLHSVHIPLENIHPAPTHRADPEHAATDYERFMRSQFEGEWPVFDVVLLGMGADGHVASLFPGSSALLETQRWVIAANAPIEPRSRLSFTLPVLNAATNVHFLVSGNEKAATLARVLAGPPDLQTVPASAVRPANGQLVWWVDEAAAEQLDEAKLAGVRVRHFDNAEGG
jgi:6-phosphogluconolactonase